MAEEEKKQVTIDDFVLYGKVRAFTNRYRPAKPSDFNVMEFDEVRLRSYFKAYVMPLGDPLIQYMAALEAKGFYLEDSFIFSEPVLKVVEKF